MNIQEYLSEVTGIYKTGAATEHSYRAALQKLFSSISDDVNALNEPKREQCGAPDFPINRGEIVVGHVEAKDIDKDLSTLKAVFLACTCSTLGPATSGRTGNKRAARDNQEGANEP